MKCVILTTALYAFQFDRDRFNDVYADLKWLESKGAGKLLKGNEDAPTPSPNKQVQDILFYLFFVIIIFKAII